MQEIISELNELGFFPDNLQPDGRLRRFKRNPDEKQKNAWGVLFENYSQTGEKFHVFVGGDWSRPSEEIKICSNKKLSALDRKVMEARVEEARSRHAEELKELRDTCKKECEKIWQEAIESETDYTKKKKIKPFGTKSIMTEKGRALLVPVKNVQGEMVGMQKILPDGTKLFHPGTEKKGSFHLIGEYINGEAFICEGFATGATIHMATGKPVVVAFDAGNLVEVSRTVRKSYPSTKVIVCGDDDRGTKDNPGREMAERAAKEGLAQVVFPEFDDQDGTDFNDVHVTFGLDRVKKILNQVEAPSTYLKSLGTHGDKFYYISSQGNAVTSLSASGHNKNNLFSLMPLQYWETVYPGKKGVKWDQAFSDLMDSCQKVGQFNPERIRGVGLWEDKGRLLINMGNGLFCDNRICGLGDLDTKYIYQAGPKIKPPVKNPLSVDECRILIDTIAHLNWKKEEAVFLLSGFVALARFCGALQWRPHLWITGGFGTGKSSVMELLIRPMLGDISLYFLGNTTEAGMRQSLGYDARPVIFDEFETNDKTTDLRVKAVLDLIRQASSESDARIAKGSAGGSAIDYRATFCAVVSSIRVNLTNGADRSRFAVLELEKVEKNAGQWDLVKKLFDQMTSDFSDRLFSRVFGMWKVIKENRRLFQRALAEKYDQRIGQQYGTLLAGYAALISDQILDLSRINEIISILDCSEREHLVKETDENDCIIHIGGTVMKIQIEKDYMDRSIGEFIEMARNEIGTGPVKKALKRFGIEIDDNFLYVAITHPELTKIYKGTKWESAGWKNSLCRLKGAELTGAKRFGSVISRAIKIPLATIDQE